MKTNCSVFLFVFCLLSSNVTPQARATVITWTNTSGGVWSLPSNWSPNQVPGSNDAVLVTLPGSYTIALDKTNVALSLAFGAPVGSGVQTLLITNLLGIASNTVVQGGGTMEITNSTGSFYSDGFVTVTSGGTLTAYAGYLDFFFKTTSLTVTNGGIVNSIGFPATYDSFLGITFPAATFDGPVFVANGGTLNASGGTGALFAVGPGGILNVTSELFTALGTNQGTIHLTNAEFAIGNFQSQPSVPGLLNLPGGVITLSGTNSINAGSYFTNQGTVLQYSGSSTIYGAILDPSMGIVTNLGGSMLFEYFGTNLAGQYYAASGAAIIFDGTDLQNSQTSNQMTLGANLSLGGPGEYQLASGYLYLPSGVATNLALACDTITLGPDFEG